MADRRPNNTGGANPRDAAVGATEGNAAAAKPKKKRIRVYPKQSSYCKFKLVDAEKRAAELQGQADTLCAENQVLRHKHEEVQVRCRMEGT